MVVLGDVQEGSDGLRLNGKPWIAEGHGSAGRRPNGHRDFYHNSGFRADGSLDLAYAGRPSSTVYV